MTPPKVYNASGLMELIHEIGFLPLLDSGITGFSAEDIVDEDCRYVTFPMGVGIGPFGNGKAKSLPKCHVCTASSSTRRLVSLLQNGGQTSATTEEASTLVLMTTP